ncbi:hypothetical protein K443DRAFT_305689 [Laccaria amethystina LaAM-08-1]|uniref:Uncharacterized protein n=1 Tax=Laccaria amethystina LaAM-08-1 TaxID=1095629 RepID=A0A0C9XCG7_9AGAR|nr:hypothetical protein K443DRAFT_305689 [Laccaria amethystina LaAM-08-1]
MQRRCRRCRCDGIAKVRNQVRRAPDSDVFPLEVWLSTSLVLRWSVVVMKRKWVGG